MCAELCHLQLLPLPRLCEEEVAGAGQTEQVSSWAVLIPTGFFFLVPISHRDGFVGFSYLSGSPEEQHCCRVPLTQLSPRFTGEDSYVPGPSENWMEEWI